MSNQGEQNPFSLPTGDDSGLSDLGSGFLNKVDPADRPVMEKYLKDWDRGVNERFQAIDQQWRPYKDLGVPFDELQQTLNLSRWMDQDPQGFFNAFADQLGIDLSGLNQQKEPEPPKVPEGWENVPKDFIDKFNSMEEVLKLVAQTQVSGNQRQIEAQEDVEFDQYLQDLANEYGEFDETYITAMIASGYDGPQAVAAYQEMVNSIGGSSPRPQLTPLNGSGAVGQSGFDPKTAKSTDVKSMIAQMLQHANNG